MKKHLTLSDRIIIEQKLNEGTSIREIARTVNKDASTIIREINKRKCPKGKRSIKVLPACANKHDCQVTGLCKDKRCYMLCRNCMACKSLCELYVPGTCTKLEKSPYVCNGCDKQGSCTYDRFFYIATYANDLYQDTLISSREGINQEPEKIREMDELISPLIKKGQPVSHIYNTHSRALGCSKSTLYNYIDSCVFSARNIDLPRKVKYKVRKTGTRASISENERLLIKERNYEKFQEYMKQNPLTSVVEMDTVVGPLHSKKVLLTLLFRNCSLMLAILLNNKSQECVIEALNWLCDELGIETFKRLFPVLLTDRGTEFMYPEAIECDRFGELKTKVFYCDPQCAWQKGMLEKNHEFIRYIVPKGHSFDLYSQRQITLMINHINSISRKSLNGCTPYKLSLYLLNNKLHEVMKLEEILPDEIRLKPALLK